MAALLSLDKKKKEDIKHPIKALAGPVKEREREKKNNFREQTTHTHTHTLTHRTDTHLSHSLSFGDVREFIHADARCNLA